MQQLIDSIVAAVVLCRHLVELFAPGTSLHTSPFTTSYELLVLFLPLSMSKSVHLNWADIEMLSVLSVLSASIDRSIDTQSVLFEQSVNIFTAVSVQSVDRVIDGRDALADWHC